MPKVLRIINRFNLGGITYNVSYLSKYLPDTYETMLIGGPEEEAEESSLFIPKGLGLDPIIIHEMKRSLNPFSDYLAYKKIKRIIKEFKPDIVHTHASKAGALGRLAARRCRVPLIIHTFHGHVFHGYFGAFKTSIVKKTERFLANLSNAIITISPLQKQEITEKHKICEASKTFVIPLGFDLSKFFENMDIKRKEFRKQYFIQEDEIAIGIIGRLAPIKNHNLFVDGIQHLIYNGTKKIKAFIIGDGEIKSQIESYISNSGIVFSNGANPSAQIVFTGWKKDVDTVLAGLDIVCLTSDNEGTPVSLIEAQAAGKFIVSTKTGGIEDILWPGAGLLSKPKDSVSFAKNLHYAVNNINELQKKAIESSKSALEKFSYNRLCRDMDQLYKLLLEGNNK